MDDSFSVLSTSTNKFPVGEPTNEWTIEELIHWSLSQYHSKAIEQTDKHIQSLRDQCHKECDNIMNLHSLAVEMAQRNNENINHSEEIKAKTFGSNNIDASTKSPTKTSPTTYNKMPGISIMVLITSGPHSSSKFLLRPRVGIPCFIGRSKGKKFVKNGISLHKDQEVSTTHGKIIVEGIGLSMGGLSDGNSNANIISDPTQSNSRKAKFYFIDVGSTNGTTLNGEMIAPETKVLLTEGIELKVGGSNLKFLLS